MLFLSFRVKNRWFYWLCLSASVCVVIRSKKFSSWQFRSLAGANVGWFSSKTFCGTLCFKLKSSLRCKSVAFVQSAGKCHSERHFRCRHFNLSVPLGGYSRCRFLQTNFHLTSCLNIVPAQKYAPPLDSLRYASAAV